MDEDEAAQVDVISGSFMFMKRELFNEIGGFDKRFFMYGEDIDLCYRISQAGHEVWYYPQIRIVHQKGKSSSKRRIRSRVYFYEAMIIFSRKYRHLPDTFFPWWLMWAGIVFQATLNIGTIIMRSVAALLIDVAAINAAMFVGWAALPQFAPPIPWEGGGGGVSNIAPLLPLAGTQALVSLTFIIMFLYNGIYSARQYTVKNIFFSGVLSSALALSGIHFLTGYNAVGFGIALAFALPATIVWREALPLVVKGLKGRIFTPESALVVGHDDDVVRCIKKIDAHTGPRIAGVVRIGGEGGQGNNGGQIEGYPVLGGIDNLAEALSGVKADVLLIAASKPWYSEIIDILVQYRNSGIDIRWEAME